MRKQWIVLLPLLWSMVALYAQVTPLSKQYVGLMPSVLVEPYDTLDAVEVNVVPILYEFRIAENRDLGFQIRPIVNYRILREQSGFSQMGATLLVNKYFLSVFEDDCWLKPQLGLYLTYAYNRLDKIQTMTLGIEPGALMKISENFSLSVNVQPGINYYPDAFSREFVETNSGFKPHLGFIFHGCIPECRKCPQEANVFCHECANFPSSPFIR